MWANIYFDAKEREIQTARSLTRKKKKWNSRAFLWSAKYKLQFKYVLPVLQSSELPIPTRYQIRKSGFENVFRKYTRLPPWKISVFISFEAYLKVKVLVQIFTPGALVFICSDSCCYLTGPYGQNRSEGQTTKFRLQCASRRIIQKKKDFGFKNANDCDIQSHYQLSSAIAWADLVDTDPEA